MKLPVSGGCHCGVVRFEAKVESQPELLDCNCSICARSQYLHLIVPHVQFKLMSDENALTSYKFGSKQADHVFCRQCGVKSFYQPRSHPSSWSVNFNCLDTGHGLEPTNRKFDGQNWEQAKAALSEFALRPKNRSLPD